MKRTRWMVWLLMAAACGETTPAPTAPCDARVFRAKTAVSYANPIDLLFVIDVAPSMAQEREHFLEAQLPAALDLLLGEDQSLGQPVDLHLGVISADMGAGPSTSVPGCSAAGDHGLLRSASACGASEGQFSWYFLGRDDRAATAAAVSCMADLSANGCPISQPLEATLEALSPATSSNTGFVRSDEPVSLVAIVILTDQDDCSNHASALDCIRNPEQLRAIQAYVNGLRSLRPGFENLVEVGIISGVPAQLIAALNEPERERLPSDYDALLADPSMQPRFADADPSLLLPSCTSASASATPPRRLVEFARDFGRSAFLRSICDYDLSELLEEMLDVSYDVALRRGDPLCLDWPFNPDDRGRLPCRITWELPREPDPRQPLTPTRCEERPGLLSVPVAGFAARSKQGRVLCEVNQAPTLAAAGGPVTPLEQGFYYDPGARCPASRSTLPLGFTAAAYPPSGVTVAIECVDDKLSCRPAQSEQ